MKEREKGYREHRLYNKPIAMHLPFAPCLLVVVHFTRTQKWSWLYF